MTRKNISTQWDRDNRNAINDNFKNLFDDFNNVVEVVSEKAYGEVVDAAKLNWKEPVNSYSDLPSEASEGDTRFDKETGRVYRFNGSEWIEIQQIDASAINEVDNRLTSQLAQTDLEVEQLEKAKMDKGSSINVGQIDKNSGKFDETYMTEKFLEQMSGDTPIHSTPARYGVTNTKLSKDAVSIDKAGFIEKPTNLFNIYAATRNATIDRDTGEVIDHDTQLVSEYIPINENSVYTRNEPRGTYFYDDDKNLIGGRMAVPDLTITPREGSAFMRITMPIADAYDFHINEGPELLPYEHPEFKIKRGLKFERQENNNSLFTKSSNVFNKNDFEAGITFDSDGSIIESDTRGAGGFVEIKPDTEYAFSDHEIRVNYYDLDKNFIINRQHAVYNDTFVTPKNAHFARFSLNQNDIDNFMVNEGAVLLAYEEYGYTLRSTNEAPIKIDSELIPYTPPEGSTTIKTPSPTRITPDYHDASFRYPGWMSDDGKVLYGILSTSIRQSIDNGESWQVIYSLPNEGTVNCIRTTDDGELLAGIRRGNQDDVGHVIKSKGYNRNDPQSATWTRVLELTEGNVYPSSWSIDVVENKVLVAEYGSQGTARKVYFSKDYGETFKEIFELPHHEDAHTHGVCYDPWFDRIWVSSGDSVNSSVRYSDDEGESWQIISTQYQPTPMKALENGIIMGTDSRANGILRIPRGKKSDTPYIVESLNLEATDRMHLIGQMIYKKPGINNPAFICFSRATAGNGVVVATMDGITFYEVFRDTESYASQKGVMSALGPTFDNKIVGVISDDRQTSYSKFIADNQEWVELE